MASLADPARTAQPFDLARATATRDEAVAQLARAREEAAATVRRAREAADRALAAATSADASPAVAEGPVAQARAAADRLLADARTRAEAEASRLAVARADLAAARAAAALQEVELREEAAALAATRAEQRRDGATALQDQVARLEEALLAPTRPSAGLEQALTFVGAQQGAVDDSRRRGEERSRRHSEKRAGRTGVLVPVAISSLGLVVQVVGYALGWLGRTGPAIPLWYAGLVLLVAPLAWSAVQPGRSARARLGTSLAFAHLLYLSWMLSDPVMQTRFDETLHVKTLVDLLHGHLFAPHDMLPVSPFFPGLELATTGVRWLTGLPLVVCGFVVVMLSRTVLVTGLFWATRRLTGSAQAAGIAVVLYGASPQFYFFNAQFSYQTVALAMLVALMVQLVRAGDARERWPWRQLLPGMACGAALAVTHHLTSWLTLGTLIALAVIFGIGRDRRRFRLTAVTAGLLAVVVVGWSIVVGPTLVSYLLPIFENATSDLVAIVAGDGPQHAPGSGAGGVPTPLYEMGLMALSILVWLAWLGPACWWAWRRGSIGRSVGRYLPLCLAAAYPGLHVMRFSEKAAEVGDRCSTFLFLALAIVVGAWLARVLVAERSTARMLRWIPLPLLRWIAVPTLVVLVVGGTILGSGPGWQRTTGPYLPAAEQRSVDARTVAVARWVAERVPAGSHIAADNTFNRMLPMYAPVRMTTGPGGFHGSIEVYLADQVGEWERSILVEDRVDFLIADYRQADTTPYTGSLFEGASGYGERASHLSSAQLDKFATTAGFTLILDGPIKVYDVRGLRGEDQTFVHRDVPAVPGGVDLRQGGVIAAFALLLYAAARRRGRPLRWSLTGLILALPALMLLGLVAALTGVDPIAGSAVALVLGGALLLRAPALVPSAVAERGREPWRRRDLLLVALTTLVLLGCIVGAGWAAADGLFGPTYHLHALGAAR